MGAGGFRVALARPHRPGDPVPARLLVLPLAAELRPRGGPRAHFVGAPWRVSHLKSPIFRKAFPDADKYLDAIEATFPYLVPDPVIPAADEYQRKLSFEITEALAKRKSPKDALDTAAAEWEKITERRGRDKQKAQWGEKLAEMKSLGIEYHPDWAAKAK